MPLTGDGYFAGEYPGGTTTVEGAPVSAAVLVYQRDSGQLIAQTESSQSGEWIVTGVDLSKAHDIVGRKEGFNDVIVSNVMPTSMVDITYIDKILPNETFTGALGYLDLVGGIPPYAASVVDPLPAGIFPVVNGRQLIIDGTTTDDDVFSSTVRITSSNGATKDVPVKLVVGFKAPANFEVETIEDAGAFSLVLTWEVTNTTQEVLVFKSATPFDLESMPAPIATLTGDAVSYTDDDVIEGDAFYYMAASVCEGFTLYSDEVEEEAAVKDPHWNNVVSLMHFDGDLTDETGSTWQIEGTGLSTQSDNTKFGSGAIRNSNKLSSINGNPLSGLAANEPFTLELWFCLESPGSVDVLMSQSGNGGDSDQFFFIAPPNYATSPPNTHNHYVLAYYRGSNSSVGPKQAMYGSTEVVADTWYHAAYVYDGTFSRLFLNGVLESELEAKGWTVTSYPFRIAGALVPDYPQYRVGFAGAIDELRITKGVARYTGNFTPPTEPFPNK